MHITHKIFFSHILFLFCNYPTFGQQPIGHHISLDGIPIEGHLDLLLFNSNKEVLMYPKDFFEKGYYWLGNHEKVKGFFYLRGKDLYYKEKSYDKKEKISPGTIKGLVMANDSFFTISDDFVQSLETIEDVSFARTIRGNIIKNDPVYFIKQGHDAPWNELPRARKKMIDSLVPFLKDYPFTLDRLVNGYFGPDEIPSIIEHMKMEYTFIKDEKLYYNKEWEQVENGEEALYHGKITERKDSLWTIDYYLDTSKIYSVTYSDFAPNRINGNVIAYNEKGNFRLDMDIDNDVIRKVTTYHANGKLHRNYFVFNNKTIAYRKVYDVNGNEISNNSGTFQERFEDDILGGTLVRDYSDFRLIESYREIEGRRSYQITDIGNDFYIKVLQQLMSDDKAYKAKLRKEDAMIALVWLQISEKGRIEGYRILNKVSYNLKNHIESFIRKYSKDGYEKLSLKRYKVKGRSVAFEIIVPFHYVDSRPQKNKINPFFNDHYLFNRQMQWNIQYQQMLNSVQIPNFNRQ